MDCGYNKRESKYIDSDMSTEKCEESESKCNIEIDHVMS
jgi:hypothetical protein